MPTPTRCRAPVLSRISTPFSPQHGESLLKMNAQRSSACNRRRRLLTHRRIRVVRSIPVVLVSNRGESGSPERCMGSLGTDNPHSTSGQTGTHRTKRPSVSVRKGTRL